MVGLYTIYHVIKSLLPALEADVDIAILIDINLVVKTEVAIIQGQPLYPETGATLVYLLVQTRAVYLSGRTKDVRIGRNVELKGVAPDVARVENLRSVCDGDTGVTWKECVFASATVAVENF